MRVKILTWLLITLKKDFSSWPVHMYFTTSEDLSL